MPKVDFCQLCLKRPQKSYTRPKSLHRTIRRVRANLQSFDALMLCNRCRRTLKTKAGSLELRTKLSNKF